MTNPFEYGRELSGAEIVDRTDEVARVVRALTERERLFLIGPRRFGKTSILRAAAEQAGTDGAVVLRYNAEAYPTLSTLAERLVADAAKALTGPVRRAGQKVQEAFSALRPQLSYDPLTDAFSASLAAAPGRTAPAIVADALDGLNALARTAERPVAVVIDEFQHMVEEGGIAAEGQIRAAVQAHDHVGYVFAGSKTRMLAEMTGDEGRPFYRLGARLFIGPVPRADFRPFLTQGFEEADLAIEPEAIEAVLDLAEDVPYNVQRLAHECWAEARATGEKLTPDAVRGVLERLVSRDDPFYTQAWNGLSSAQQKALLATAHEGGTGLYAGALVQAYGLTSPSTMRSALKALVQAAIVREEEQRGSVRYRLEDPFFAAWLRLFVQAP